MLVVATHYYIFLFDLATETWERIISNEQDPITDIAIHPSQDILAYGTEDGTIHIYDIENKTEPASFDAHSDEILSISFSADGQWLASTGYDGVVRIWNMTSYSLELEVTREVEDLQIGWTQVGTFTLDFGPEEPLLAVGGVSPIVHLFDVEEQVMLWETKWDEDIPQLIDAADYVRSINFSSDGHYIAYTTAHPNPNYARIIDAKTGNNLIDLQEPDDFWFPQVKFNQASTILATKVGKEIDATHLAVRIKLWDWQANSVLNVIEQPYIETFLFSSDDTLLVIAGDETLYFWAVPAASE